MAGELERHFQRSDFPGDDDLVFCHPLTGRPYDASKLRKRFDRAIARAGVRRITFHGLRHTFGTRMAAAGAPLRHIQEWMGHRDHATTLLYADYAPDPSGGADWAQRAFSMPEGPDGDRGGAVALRRTDRVRAPEDGSGTSADRRVDEHGVATVKEPRCDCRGNGDDGDG